MGGRGLIAKERGGGGLIEWGVEVNRVFLKKYSLI